MQLRAAYESARQQLGRAVEVIRTADEGDVEREVLEISRTRRWLAPLAVVVSAFTMLFAGLKLLVSNWRLTLVQIPPAVWIWVLMIDLKAHVLHGRDFTQMSGPLLALVLAAVVAMTMVCFHMNAVFAFAITQPGKPDVRAARQTAPRAPTHDPRLGLRHRRAGCVRRVPRRPHRPVLVRGHDEHRRSASSW